MATFNPDTSNSNTSGSTVRPRPCQSSAAAVRRPSGRAAQRHGPSLAPGSLAFTCCQTPIVYRRSSDAGGGITIAATNGRARTIRGLALDRATSREIFQRTGCITQITVDVPDRLFMD
ncbi:MAG: hypothetical protein WD042_11305 [Phycisphaeraceae bacterium]